MEFNQGLLGEWMMEWGEINKPNEVLLKSNMVEKIGFYHTFAAGTLGLCNMLIHISLFFGLLSGIPMALKMISLCSCYPQERLDPFRFSPLCFKTMYSGKKFIFLKFWSVHIFMQFKNSKRFFFSRKNIYSWDWISKVSKIFSQISLLTSHLQPSQSNIIAFLNYMSLFF